MDFSKRLLAIIPIVVCIVVLLILGGTNAQIEQEENQSSFLDKKDTLYFWYSDETITDYINRVAVAFGEENNVRILPVLVSDSEYLESINEASLKEEQVPDLYCISNDSLEKAYLAGLASAVQDEGEVINGTNYSETALLAVTYHDKYVAYPFYYETSALFYNKDYVTDWQQQQESLVLEEGAENETEDQNSIAVLDVEQLKDLIARGVPETMKEVLSFADYYDAPESVQGVMKWDVTDIFYNYHFAGDYLNVGGVAGDDDTQIEIYRDEVLLSLKEYQDLSQIFYIETEAIDPAVILDEFMAGEMVFTIATTDAIAVLNQAKEEETLLFDYGIAQLPKVENSSTASGVSVTTTVVVNGYSAQKELANEFAAYLVNENYDDLYTRTGKVSTHYNANLDNDNLQMFMEVYEQSTSLPKLISTSNYWIQLEVMFLKIWSGEDIAEQLQVLQEQIQYQITGQ